MESDPRLEGLGDLIREVAVKGEYEESQVVQAVGYYMKIHNAKPESAGHMLSFILFARGLAVQNMTEDMRQMLLALKHLKLKTLPHHNHLKAIGRNDKCPCGSDKKYKQCCLENAKIAEAH